MEIKYENDSLDDIKKSPEQNISIFLRCFGEMKLYPNKDLSKFASFLSDNFVSEYIHKFIYNIMIDNIEGLNIILFNTCIKKYMSSEKLIFYIIKYIFDIFVHINQNTKNNVIQKDLDDGTFTINSFMNVRSLYYTNSNTIKDYLNCINNYICFDEKNRLFQIIRDYAFFDVILNTTYTYNGNQSYMFSILIEYIDHNNREDILNVFKIVNIYKGFSYSVTIKEHRKTLFNSDILDNQGLDSIIPDNVLIDYVKNIDSNIKSTVDTTLSKIKKDQVMSSIINDINMCKKIANKELFKTLYHIYLQKRLLSYTIPNTIVESKLLDTLSEPYNNRINILMDFTINDCIGTTFINNEFKNIMLSFNKGVYSQEMQNAYDRNIATFYILRECAWTSIDNIGCINVPALINIHLDIFNKYYTTYFTKRFTRYSSRKINYNYNMSTVDIKLSINNTSYNLHMNLIQASILGHIYNNTELSDSELTSIMNIQLNEIILEIDTLIYSNIVIRKSTFTNGNIENIFCINLEFTSDKKDINLIEIIDILQNYHDNNDNNRYTQTIIQLIITEIILNEENKIIHKDMLYEKLLSEIKNHNEPIFQNTVMTNYMFNDIIMRMICSNIIIDRNNVYSINNSDPDFDLHSDDMLSAQLSIIDDITNTEEVFSDITDTDDDNDNYMNDINDIVKITITDSDSE